MVKLEITIKEYERTAPILRGQVTIRGIEPIFVQFAMENFRHMLVDLEYDISEMSFSSYLIGRERNVPVVAIPVFPNRRFRHSYIFVDTKGKIREPRDLIGKKVGIPSLSTDSTSLDKGNSTTRVPSVRPRSNKVVLRSRTGAPSNQLTG